MRSRLKSYFKTQRRRSLPQLPPPRVDTPVSSSTSESSAEDWQSVDECPSSDDDVDCTTKAQDLWQRVKEKCQLVDFHALPEYLRENEFILRHYRADWPLRDAVFSMFRIHNETLNIWTHLIGFLLFLGLTIFTAWHTPKSEYPALPTLTTMPSLADMSYLRTNIMACLPKLPSFTPSLFNSRHKSFAATNATMMTSGVVQPRPQCIAWTMKEDLGKLVEPLMRKRTTRWPFFMFLAGAMFCLLTSSTCHLLCCHSSRLSNFLWRLDYAGIAAMIATSFFPPVYYTFLCHARWRNFYLTSITVMGLLTVFATVTPSMHRNEYRTFRTLLFCGMAISGIIPGVHKVMSFHHEQLTLATTTYEVLMGIFYGLGVLFYATRFPERWRPGFFDIAGHSHQIFHILVVCGAYAHYKAALLYIEWRDGHGCD